MTSTSTETTSERRRRLDPADFGRVIPAILIVLLAGLVLRLLIAYVWLPGEGLFSDLRLFRIWSETLATNGPGGFYQNAGFADYAPGYLWVLWGMGVLAHGIAGLTGAPPADVINGLLKLPAIGADLAMAGLLYWAGSRWGSVRTGLLAAALYLFVPVTWYDSALWGQVDAIGALLLLGAILLLIAGWSEPAVAVAVMAAVTKPQYGIGLVIIGAVLIRRHLLARGSGPIPSPRGWLARLDTRLGGWFTRQQGPLRLVSCALVAVAVGIIAILPFDLPSQAPAGIGSIPILGSIAGLASVIGSAAAYYSVLTVNAFNAWALVGPNPLAGAISSQDLTWTADSLQVLGPISAASLGAALLVLTTMLVVATLWIRDDPMSILLAFCVLAIAFFVLPTRVHERYLFPVFGVGALVAAMSPRWLAWYIALAVTNVANLHAVLTLPFQGYGTPGVQGLPLGSFLRDPFVVGIIADLHTLLFIGVMAAFFWQVSLPAFRSLGATRGRSSEPMPGAVTPRLLLADTGSEPTERLAPIAPRDPSSPSAAVRRRSRLDRKDLGVFVGVMLIVLVSRLYRLDMPRTMYFDERWHATTATEFLQDWRYGMPHALSEWTHPHLAKYLMAAGIVAFGGDRVTGVGLLDSEVTDATFEPTYPDPIAPDGLGGNRIVIATGDSLRIAEQGALSSALTLASPGAISVGADPSAHWTVVGSSDGGVSVYSSSDLAGFAQSGATPTARPIGQLDGPVVRVWPLGDGRVAALTKAGRLSILNAAQGGIVSTLNLPGLEAVLPIGPPDKHLAVLALPTGLALVETSQLGQIQLIGVPGGARGLAYVDGSDQGRRERDLLPVPTIYVATGSQSLTTYTVAADGALAQAATIPMPGPVSDVKWDRATNMIHVLGATADGTPTIYVVEPHGNAVFTDVPLEFLPTTWVLDAQPNDPGHDRQRAIAFASAGLYATVDAGSHAFGWRFPGVVLGTLTVGLLYLMARLLFRRRRVALLFVGIVAIDGLLFQQSRIAMNDVYALFFIVAGFTLLAWFLQSGAVGRRARLELLTVPPLLGVLFGLALASKWVAAYAVGGAVLIILLRSWLGRRIALAAMLALTSVFGYLAIADDPANVAFLVLMVGLTAVLAVGIVRAEARPSAGDPGPRWLQPSWHRGVPFAWVLAALAIVPFVVYVASYIPWALSTTGQSFIDLQVQMYRYHDELRFPHGAGSPWWAWPPDLKPVWGYLETFVDGTQATVFGAANPFLLWMSVPALGYGMWQAWRRRSRALGFVAIAFLVLWLPWARIDRVTFEYHYVAALPFAFLMLAWFLAEILDHAKEPLLRFARPAFGVVLYMPALLWVFKGPLCAVAGVDQANPGSPVCAASLADVALPVIAWVVFATVVLVFGVIRATPRQMVAVMLGLAVAMSIVLYPALSAVGLPNGWPWIYQGLLPTWDSGFQFSSNTAAAVAQPLLGVGTLVVLAIAGAIAAGAIYLARGRGAGSPGAGGGSDDGDADWAPAARPAPDPVPPPIALVSAGAGSAARESGRSTTRASRMSTIWPIRVRGLSTPWFIVGMAIASVVAAMIAGRVSLVEGRWLLSFDTVRLDYPLALIFHNAVSHGSLPLWDDSIRLGYPLYAEGHLGVFYPPNWLIFQLRPLQALDVSRVLHLVLAGVGGGLITLRLSGSRTGAMATALVFVFCGGIAGKLEWSDVVVVYGWMPWVFLPLLWERRGPTLRFILLAAVAWGIQALGGHPPYWVLTGIGAVAIILVRLPSLTGLRRVTAFGVTAVLIGAIQLIPTALITVLSDRALARPAIFEYSGTPFDFLGVGFANAFVPAGGPAWDFSQGWYPGGFWAILESYPYVGLPALAFAIVGLRVRRLRPLLALAAIAIVLPMAGALQVPILAPVFSLFRHPIRAYLLLDVALAVGAGVGIARLGRAPLDRRAPAIVLGLAVAGYLIVTLLAVAPSSLVDGFWRFLVPDIADAQHLAAQTLTSAWPLVMEIGLGVIALLAVRSGRRSVSVRLGAVALVVLPMVLLVHTINASGPLSAITLDGTPLVQALRQTGSNAILTIGEPYSAALDGLVERDDARDPHLLSSQLAVAFALDGSDELLAELRSQPGSLLPKAMGIDTVVAYEGLACPGTTLATFVANGGTTICHLDGAIRAPYWMPALAVPSLPEAANSTLAPSDVTVDLSAAVADTKPARLLARDAAGMSMNITAPGAGFVWIDRSWWPGWQVSVDGESVDTYRAWGGQLVPVTAGTHSIEQRFVPPDVLLGGLLTVFGLIVAIGVVVTIQLRHRTPASATTAVAPGPLPT